MRTTADALDYNFNKLSIGAACFPLHQYELLQNIETIFDEIGLRDCFQAVVTAEDVNLGKPDPEVFLKSAEKIGVEPRNCVVFEAAQVGIEAGLAAGSKVIAVATTNDISQLGRASAAVGSLEEVDWKLFAGLFGRD